MRPGTYRVMYSLLHLECHLISFSNLNLLGLLSDERGKRDLENEERPDFCHVQPIASGVSFLHSQICIDELVLYVSFTTFR